MHPVTLTYLTIFQAMPSHNLNGNIPLDINFLGCPKCPKMSDFLNTVFLYVNNSDKAQKERYAPLFSILLPV
ncbi:Uncharacterised protein [Chlamydia trachomatis]|nr:Uncharacterised protein [Chlamydia trachomatis]